MACLSLAVCGFVGGSAASAAPAQIDVTPTCPSAYPPDTQANTSQISVTSASFTPGGSGSLSLAGTIPDHSYTGTIFSTPINVGPSSSDAAGNLSFSFAVPADFELGATHSMSLSCEDVLSATFQFCLNSSGTLTSSSACAAVETPRGNDDGNGNGSLARTGIDHAFFLLRVALVLVAVGALLIYLKRSRERARLQA